MLATRDLRNSYLLMTDNSHIDLQKGKTYVLDTSAIFSAKFNLSEGNFLISRNVINEIKLGKVSRLLNMSISSLRVVTPSDKTIIAVKAAAKETGDLQELSDTDIGLIAIALETNSTLVTDDFAMENVANFLGIKFEGADLKKIGYKITWGYRCTGCGQRFSEYSDACPICGHRLKRFAKKYKAIRND